MEKYIKDIIEKLEEIYVLYERYVLKLLQEHYYTKYDESFIEELGNRIYLTKKLLRGDI